MPIPGYPDRPIVRQRLFTQAITIGTTPTILWNDPALYQSYPTTFFVSIPTGGASIFIGPAGVSVTSGLEIIAGAGIASFPIINKHQDYELQDPILQLASVANCQNPQPQMIPFVVWDLSQLFGVSAAGQACVIGWTLAEFV